MKEYCQIELTQGQVAQVSPEDWEELIKYKWYALRNRGVFYAVRAVHIPGFKRQRIVMMHRAVMDAPSHMTVDHIHGDTLDNRRESLRLATGSENSRNRKIGKDNTSGYKGVSLYRGKRWTAGIWLEGRRKHLGYYSTPQDAHAAYCAAAKKHFGEFARAA